MNPKAQTLKNAAVLIRGSSLPAPVLSSVGHNLWDLVGNYVCTVRNWTFTIPGGFRFDLASVPRLFWFAIAPFDLSISAPLLHDYLYFKRGDLTSAEVIPPHHFSRAEADGLFLEIMILERVLWWRRWLAYGAVRAFGWLGW